MADGLVQDHRLDEDERPAGGYARGVGMVIQWQNGPVVHHGRHHERTGASVEDVIDAAIGRLEFYQHSRRHCLENAVALGHLRAAVAVLEERNRARRDRGVEVPYAEIRV